MKPIESALRRLRVRGASRMGTVIRVTGILLVLVAALLAACEQQPASPAPPVPVTIVVTVVVPPRHDEETPDEAGVAGAAPATWRGRLDELLAEADIGPESETCVSCHSIMSPRMVELWAKSEHAPEGADCMACHSAERDDWDYYEHYNEAVATNPTAGDCATCHETEYDEFSRSKHSALSMIFVATSFDRNVFEPTLTTKHGCQQCHNIGHFWPDGSVGECDACQRKHACDVAGARNPDTCGEGHLGPDHPHIEIWEESKHGKVFMSNPENWELLGYDQVAGEPPPFDAPTCTTCHMDATVTMSATHDVGSRMAWETQSPWTIRTTEAWGGGLSWEEKRLNETKVCLQCHAQPFVDRYLLEGDLMALQYNEIYREARRWLTAMDEAGIILTAGFEGLAPFGVAGYDDPPEEVAYHIWHHEGRRYRHGALMMAADYTQWHGIWDLQKDLVEIIRYGAEHGLPEAEAWLAPEDPDKFWLYPFYDVPGSVWGIDTITFRSGEDWTTKVWMNREGQEGLDAYWAAAYANVEAAYAAGLLSEAQWELYQELYENRQVESGSTYPLPPLFQVHLDGKATDDAAGAAYGAGLGLPAGGGWEYEPEPEG